MPTFPSLSGDLQTEVLIIGGGMVGILCAHKLKEAGIDHVLIESGHICGGVTGKTSAKITSQHGLIYHKLLRQFGPDRARLYWEANQSALEQFRRLGETIPCDFETRDNFLYSRDFPDSLTRELTALQQLGIPADYVSRPQLPFPTCGAIRFPQQAQFHPLKFVSGLATGLPIFEHTEAFAFDGKAFLTAHGRITARKTIVATHFPIFNKQGLYFLKMYQQRSYVLALENAGTVDGMYLDEAEGGFSLRNQGDLLLLGGGSHRTGKESAGWEALEALAKSRFPAAREVARWATQDCMTLDGVPYIGQYSRHSPDLYVATGFNKWGMTVSMVAADILCALVQEKPHPHAGLFSPQRSMLRPQLASNLASSLVGLLKPTRPRCPHLGCSLKWNRQERSWDCPCHGSRFSEEGELLDGPATGPLPRSRQKP